jgi:hypothetical protein
MRWHVLMGFSGAMAVLWASACDSKVTGGQGDECEPVTCEMYCEYGFAAGEDGCEICACADAPCDAPNPVGCTVTGCDVGETCDTSAGCAPSSCSCDAATGSWICTEDCGGGECVPDGGACDEPNPEGCASTGCDDDEVCDTSVGCFPSSCSCDAATGGWICTDDCGGGACVPDGGACDEPNPAGCISTGCDEGEICDTSIGCFPSGCFCDEATGGWACTDDCGGGQCVPAGGVCDPSLNPVGCSQTGCPGGLVCDTTVGCHPSACFCDPATGWGCTDDCGGGECVSP